MRALNCNMLAHQTVSLLRISCPYSVQHVFVLGVRLAQPIMSPKLEAAISADPVPRRNSLLNEMAIAAGEVDRLVETGIGETISLQIACRALLLSIVMRLTHLSELFSRRISCGESGADAFINRHHLEHFDHLAHAEA